VVPHFYTVSRMAAAHAQRRGGPLGALRDPRYRSGYALIANVAATTIVGLGFWAAAAHLYSRERVGEASALVAALVLVSSFAQLNLNNTLPRFLTQAGRQAGRLIGYGYAASSAAALVIGLAVITVLPQLSPHWHFLGNSVLLRVAFVGATIVWGVFALQDYVLLGLQQPIVVPLENMVYGVTKLLMLLGVASLLPETGIFIAWIVPLAITVPAVNWLIFRRYLKDWKPATADAAVRPRVIIRFTSVDYVGNLLIQTAWNLLPLLVLTALGAPTAASFYIAWSITTGLNLVANSFATSLLVEGSAKPSRLGELTRGTLARTLIVTIAGAALFGLGARLILSVYGHGYATRASLVLGLLAAGSVFYGLLAIVFSVDRITGRVGKATVTRLVLAILTLGGSWALLPRMGSDGIGVAWLGANLLVALARVPTIFGADRLRADAPARAVTQVARNGSTGFVSEVDIAE
jgi:O-antigen/teichoic acid export membrane protein